MHILDVQTVEIVLTYDKVQISFLKNWRINKQTKYNENKHFNLYCNSVIYDKEINWC